MSVGKWILRTAYLMVAVAMAAVLIKQRDTIGEVLRLVDPLMVLAASGVLVCYRVINASIWGLVLNGLGASVSFLAATRVWLMTEALRWLPGGIWGFCSRVGAAKRLGLSKRLAGVSLSVELAITIMAWGLAMVLGIGCAGILPAFLDPFPKAMLALSMIASAGFLAILWLLRHWLLEQPWMRRLAPVGEGSLRWRPLATALAAYAGLCAMNGIAFYLLIQAFPQGEAPISLAAAIGINAAGWLAGFFAIGAPGGLGAREAALAAMLSPFLRLESIVLLVAAWRLLQMLVEAVTLATFAATRRERASASPAWVVS